MSIQRQLLTTCTWDRSKKWFRSKWWSVPIILSVFVVAVAESVVANLKTILEWFGVK